MAAGLDAYEGVDAVGGGHMLRAAGRAPLLVPTDAAYSRVGRLAVVQATVGTETMQT
jgi:hypothetical protein